MQYSKQSLRGKKKGVQHFFTNRYEGVQLSHLEARWRLGSGNVFTKLKSLPTGKKPDEYTIEEQEYLNAIANLRILIGEHAPEAKYQVILNSNYGKGISVVDDQFLAMEHLTKDPAGRIVIEGDGLFSMKEEVLLLNKSGDAHAIIFESPTAIGIAVGSWRGIAKGLLSHMQEYFLKNKIDPADITVRIGPGLGSESYDLGEKEYQEILIENPEYKKAFTRKPTKPSKPPKYLLNMIELIKISNEPLGMKVDASETENTFPREEWHIMRDRAKEQQNAEPLKEHYGQAKYFGARWYSRVEKYAKEFNKQSTGSAETDSKARIYADTGRCLNGVIRYNKP